MPITTRTPDETRWLSAHEQTNWRSYLMGSNGLTDHLDADLRKAHGISLSEYEVLVRLSEAPEHTIRMAELAGRALQSRSRLTHTVGRLEKVGIVARQRCSDDGRGINAVLTAKGFALLEQAAHTHVRGVREHFLDQMTPEEFDVIGRVFARVDAQFADF